MSDPKLGERFATPSSSKLAQILLDLRGVEGSAGICNLQQSDIQLWSEAYKQDDNATTGEVEQSSQQDTCNCRKSKCLKLYCQCFAARATCSSSCRCVSCENKPDNAATRDAAVNLILERNPNAFDSKYRPTATSSVMSNTFTAITGIAHKNGCRCRKSMCLKKYCECFQGGVPCSSICTCLTCQNTGPAVHLAASSSAAPVPSASAPTDRALSAASTTLGSEVLLLSNHSNLSEHSLFATTSGLGSNIDQAQVYSNAHVYSDQNDVGAADAGPNSSRPPLVPSNKRKRENTDGSSSARGEYEEGEPGSDEEERRARQSTAVSGSGTDAGCAGTPTPLLALPLTPNMSRAQQQQLLRELLFQELQSQGILSSPLTSFLTTNCPGLMQSQGTTIDDINNLFRNGTYAGVSTPGAPGTLLSFTPGGMTTADKLLPSPPAAVAAASSARTVGASIASPNTFSIATALALLAANAQAQAIAAQQQQQPQPPPSLMGICEGGSQGEVLGRSSVPASALAMDSARRLQQHASYEHDTITMLSSQSKIAEGHACTPVAVAPLLGAGDHSQGGMTDEETLGSGGSAHSDDTLPDRRLDDCSDLRGLPAKTLFGNDGLPSPDAVEAPRRMVQPLAKAAGFAAAGMGYGVTTTRVEIESAAKENALPNANTLPSATRMEGYGSLWR